MRSVTPICWKTLREVRLDGLLADPELAGDQLVRQALRDAASSTSRSRSVSSTAAARGAARGAQHGARRLRVERRLAPRGGADAADQLVGLGVLEQVADGAGVERGEDASRSENDVSTTTCARLGRSRIAARRLDAVEVRHREVHQHDVGAGLGGDELTRLRAVGGRRRPPRCRRRSRAAARARRARGVVLGEQDADHVAAPRRRRASRRPARSRSGARRPPRRARSGEERAARSGPPCLDGARIEAAPVVRRRRAGHPSRSRRRSTLTAAAPACATTFRTASCADRGRSSASVVGLEPEVGVDVEGGLDARAPAADASTSRERGGEARAVEARAG